MSNPEPRQLTHAKAALRRELRAARRALSPATRRAAAIAAARHALRLLAKRRHVAVYFACGGELDTAPLIHLLARAGKSLYLPRLHGSRMRFVRWRPRAPLRRNRFGIPEPVAAARAQRLDAVVMPLVGFDAAGNRLGQGGGYYDRAAGRGRALRLGFAFAVQQAPRIAIEPHDLRLNAIVTERGTRRFR